MYNLLNRLPYILLCLLLFKSTSALAVQKEYVLKAGFLYNFARFGQWQITSDTTAPFAICSPDKQFIDIANAALEGRKVHTRQLINKHIELDTQTTNNCDIVFITDNTYTAWQSLKAYNVNNVMLVGETDGFIEQGGQIRFFLSSGKIRFEVAPSKLKEAGITMSSKVLRLARVVEG